MRVMCALAFVLVIVPADEIHFFIGATSQVYDSSVSPTAIQWPKGDQP